MIQLLISAFVEVVLETILKAVWGDTQSYSGHARGPLPAVSRGPSLMSRWDNARDDARQADPRQTGHRREFDPRHQPRQSFAERKELALTDVAVFRTVSVRDLAAARFGGHPFTTRKAINSMVRAGWMREHTAKGPKGRKFKVLTVTRKGAHRGKELAAKYGLARTGHLVGPGQTGRGPPRRGRSTGPSQAEKAKLEKRGCVVERIRIDAEMKREIARATASRAAALERRRVARELGLPVAKGKVLVPDAQIQYRDPDGRAARVNIEVVSEHYSDARPLPPRPPLDSRSIPPRAVDLPPGRESPAVRRAAAGPLPRSPPRLGAPLAPALASGGGRGGGRAKGTIEL